MADVPINIVNLNVPFEDEPGAGDPAPAVNMGPMLEAVRNIGQSVTQINGNIRAILETLRTIARSGIRGGGGGRRGGGRGAAAGGEDDPIRQLREAQRQRLYMARRGISLAMSEEEVSMHRGDVLPPTGSEGFYGSFFSVIDRNAAAMSRQAAQGIREAQREEQARQREQRRQEAREQRESLRAAQRRMTNAQANRIDELRRMVGSRTGLNYTDEELSLLSGQASPSGLPGTRAFARSLHSLNARAAVHGPALPPTPPPLPMPAAPQNPLAAVMGVFNTVRSILAVIGRISAVLGLVTLIAKILGKMSQVTERQRENLSRIDPVYSMMEANLMISRLRADIAVAQNPMLRAQMQTFTNVQMARAQAQIPLRIAGGAISTAMGTMYEQYMLSMELVAGGIMTGNVTSWMQGQALAGITLLRSSVIGALFGSTLQNAQANILAQITGNARATTNGLFMADFERLTGGGGNAGGTWRRDRAYGRNRNAANWWR